MAKDNPFRFSTKYTDNETRLVYYGYRYYSPGLGRWVSRDPMGENGFSVLSNRKKKEVLPYEFCHNRPVDKFDKLGLHACAATKNANCMGFPVTMNLISDTKTCIARCRRWHECKWYGSITWGDVVKMGYTASPGVDLEQEACSAEETDGRREFDITCWK